jgi:hypothetical protein
MTRTISAAHAVATGIRPSSLDTVADWHKAQAARLRGPARERHINIATRLRLTAGDVRDIHREQAA